MPLTRTLSRSILLEVALYGGLGFAVFVGITVVQNVGHHLDELAAVGLRGSDAWAVTRCLAAMLAAYAVPVGFVFGTLVTIARMSSDAEVVAMRACGLGLGALLRPVMAMAAACTLLTGWLLIEVEPAARLELRHIAQDLASRGAVVEPGYFNKVADRIVFVQSRGRDNQLMGIFISDRTDPEKPFFVFAERGRFVFEPDEVVIRLKLESGDIHMEGATYDDDRYRRIAFENFDYAIDASPILESANRARPFEMPMAELAWYREQLLAGTLPPEMLVRSADEYHTQFHRRLALPFVPLLLSLLAVPLALRPARGARSWGMLVCAALVGIYYIFLTFGYYAAESGLASPGVAMWMPNIVFGLAAVPFLVKAQRGEA